MDHIIAAPDQSFKLGAKMIKKLQHSSDHLNRVLLRVASSSDHVR